MDKSGEEVITSKQVIGISERFLVSKTFPTGYASVFVNPSQSDLVDLKKHSKPGPLTIRFVADARGSGEVYIWEFSTALHYEVRAELKMPFDYFKDSKILNGQAEMQGGRLVFSNREDTFLPNALRISKKGKEGQYCRDFLKNLKASDFSWLERYVSGSTAYINKCKSEFKG